MSASMKWRHLDHLELFSRGISPVTEVAKMEVSPQDEMANPQGTKVFAVERHELPEDFVSFRALCGVQSSPLVFASNCAFLCGLLQGQAPELALCLMSVLS